MIVRFPFVADSRPIKFKFVADSIPHFRYPIPNEIAMMLRAADDVGWSAQIIDIFNDIKMQLKAQENLEFHIETGLDKLSALLALASNNFGDNYYKIGGLDRLKIGLLDYMHIRDFVDDTDAVSLKIGLLEDEDSGKINMVLRAEDDLHIVVGIPIKVGEIDETKIAELDEDILPDYHYIIRNH